MQSEITSKVSQILALQTQSLSSNDISINITECLTAWEELVEYLSELDLFGLIDIITFYSELLTEFSADKTAFNEDERIFLQQGNNLFDNFFNTYSPEAVEALLVYLQHPNWVTPLSNDDIEAVRDLVVSDCETLSPVIEADELEINFCPLDMSLLESSKVCVEPELTAMIGGQINLVTNKWQQPNEADLAQLLEKTLETLEPIAKAAEMLNLWGIRQLLIGFERNLQLYQEDTSLLIVENYVLIKTVLDLMADYFVSIGQTAVSHALIEVFTDLEWPYSVTDEEQVYLNQLFDNTRLADKAVIVEQQACEQDIDLTIPEDVDKEFLETMFSELPVLSVEFTESLLAIINDKDVAALAVARRHAHTLKGLASTGGVKGVANLTHALEDILELLAEKSQFPDAVLSGFLLDAADCVDGMNEALLSKNSAPENALSILQNLHHCFYLLRTGEVISDSNPSDWQAPQTTKPNLKTETSQTTVQPSSESEKVEEDSFVRVSKSTLTTLLKIAAETTTLNAQVNEQLKQIDWLIKNSRERYRSKQQIIAELEEHVQSQFTLSSVLTKDSKAFDPLELDRYNYLHSSISRLYEASADSREVDIVMGDHVRRLDDLFANQSRLQKENLTHLIDTRLLAVSTLTPRLQRVLRQACRTANKKAHLEIKGENLLIDGQVLNQLADPLMHIIRNAIDHGVEDAHQRFEKDKPETGLIKLSFTRHGEMIKVTCEDDGQGLNHKEIRATAIAKGLISEETQLSTAELDQLILLAGFSTKSEVSQLSGRGIGMDIVFQEIQRLKGNLEIKSASGQGSRFILSLPTSSLILKALLVQSGQQVLSLASYGVKQSVLSLDGQLQTLDDGSWQFVYQGKAYPAYSLEMLTSNKPVNYEKLKLFPVLFVNTSEKEQVAVFVSAMLAHKEVVFKEISSYLPPLQGILGLTHLATGEISPLLDIAALIKQQSGSQAFKFTEQISETEYKLPTLLIVDDSLSARKAIAALLKDSGYLIQTAIDGVEALDKIQRDPPDLVITDYEMPRMDGVELASVLKNQEKTAHLPVLMITSRSTDKHREEANRAGVDYYLTKPWQESVLLDAITQLLPTSSFA